MAKQQKIKNLRDEIRKAREKFWEIKGRIKQIEEREKELRDELERVREHLTYYESLVSDMKKEMKTKKSTDILEEL